MPLTSGDPELKSASLCLCRAQMEVTIGSASNKATPSKEILFLINFSIDKSYRYSLLKKRKRRMSAKEASTFSNYIFSNCIVLQELGQNTTSKPDLILQRLSFFTCILKRLPTITRLLQGLMNSYLFNFEMLFLKLISWKLLSASCCHIFSW